uniref:DJ-1/PfpI domain-containing protein n=1 Tax=Fagus sylvatica TaxID=28930 RepID=A0A2N9EXU3_FAGSY
MGGFMLQFVLRLLWRLRHGATCYPSFMEQLAPNAIAVESRVQVDGKVVTSRGPGTTMEYAVALVEQLYGKEKAKEVSDPMVMRSNHADEYVITELNPVEWTFDDCPKRVRERKPKKAKTKPLLPCCELRSCEGHHRQTPRPVGLTPAAAAALSPSSHSVTTPDAQTGSAIPGVSDLILVPIANGTEEMEAVIIIDILRRAKANVVVASVDDKLEILASRKVKLVADVLLDEAAKFSYDLIVLPGGIGGAQAFANSEKLVNLLKQQREANKPFGAICASPALVLEPHGLLKGKKATAFPALSNKLSDQSEAENRVVVDGNLITSRGPGTTIEFALAIVEKLFGRTKALEIARTTLFISP